METIDVLVTVKAYPALSSKYGEVECVAGVRMDTGQPEWVRLFPVPYRELPYTHRVKKYQRIRLEAEPHRSDPRPESYRPNVDSFELGEILDTKDSWAKRREYVDPLEVESMCELRRLQQATQVSLGVFRPAEVLDFTAEADSPGWDPQKEAVTNQPSLLFQTNKGLEKIPYRFRYKYRCSDAGCRGHEQSIVDWELAESYRSWRNKYKPEELLDKLRQRWLDEMCGSDKDTRFFVGNQHLRPDAFMVLGVFWPPKV